MPGQPPQQPSTARQQPDRRALSDRAVLRRHLPAPDKPELGAEGARAAVPEGTRAKAALAMLSSVKRSDLVARPSLYK